MKLNDIQVAVLKDRYALPGEEDIDDVWNRVSRAVAEIESDKEHWRKKFYDLLKDFTYVPGGRILRALGAPDRVTAMNCYVIPSPEDSREGIMKSLSEWVEIQSRGGGVGINLSTLRPRGFPVKGVGGESSGPVNWAQPFAFISHNVIIQGGSRRGAAMIMLNDDHPDIFEFIHAKETPGVLEGCNISVCISDAFMEAVKNDGDWDLKWNGKVVRTIKARQLFQEICEAAWKSGEPGVYFIERANKEANSGYFETLIATNPCVTGDTWTLIVDENWKIRAEQVKNLIGKTVILVVNGQLWTTDQRGFFRTGTKEVYLLTTKEGYRLKLTGDHLVATPSGWVCAKSLKLGDKIILNNHENLLANCGEDNAFKFGYLAGYLIGDGYVNDETAIIEVWKKRDGYESVMDVIESYAKDLYSFRSDFKGWIELGDKYTIKLRKLWKDIVDIFGVSQKEVNDNFERQHLTFVRGFLRGLFDADGSVQGSADKGGSIRLSQSDKELLVRVQRMLLRLGIKSKIYRRRPSGTKLMPDGKKGLKEYNCRDSFDLVISRKSLLTFANVIGFANKAKAGKLDRLISSYSGEPYSERFTATVASMELIGYEEVYDASVPGINAFDANGILVHNCGEQPLGPYGACLLGAFNLTRYLEFGPYKDVVDFNFERLAEDVAVAVRFNDNVIDLAYYPLSQCRESQQAIRRMGMGVMGLADALLYMQIRYGSEEAQNFTRRVFRTIRDAAYLASAELAKERGPFPMFESDKYLSRPFIQRLPEEIRNEIAKYGIRNCYLLTQAPTGTTSLLAGVNSGIEPYFDFSYIRKDRLGAKEIKVAWAELYNSPDRPEWLVTTHDLTPLDHVKVQAAVQEFNDSSVSKTVNAPHNDSVENVMQLYLAAYDYGLKSITYYRDGSRQEQVLYRKDSQPVSAVTPTGRRKKLPAERQSITHKFEVGGQKGYLTVGLFEDGTPAELFVHVSKRGSTINGLLDSVAMLTSYALQYGVPLEDLVEKMSNTRFEPSGMTSNPDIPVATSIVDYIFRWMSKKFLSNEVNEENKLLSGDTCPECGGLYFASEGCFICRDCGHSKCG